MPLFSYLCENQHTTERFFSTITEGDEMREAELSCTVCGAPSKRIEFVVPLTAHLYGNPDGYYRPSPSKRSSTKTVNSWGNNPKPPK